MGRQIIKDGNAGRLRLAGDPPVEAGKIDQHDCVGRRFAKHPLGPFDERVKLPEQGDDAEDADDGQVGQFVVDVTAGLGHFRSAVAAELQIGLTPLECVNQAGRMLVTAGLADGEEDPHDSGRFRPRRGRVELLGRPSTAGGGVGTEGPLDRPIPRFGSDQLLRQPQHGDRVAGRLLHGRVQTDRRHQVQTVVNFLKVLVAGQGAQVPLEAAEGMSHQIGAAVSDGAQKGDAAGRRQTTDQLERGGVGRA